MKYLIFSFLMLLTSCVRVDTPDPKTLDQNIISVQLEIIKDGVVIKTIKEQCVESKRCTIVLLNNELEEHTFPQDYKCSLDNVLTKYIYNLGYEEVKGLTCKSYVIKESNIK